MMEDHEIRALFEEYHAKQAASRTQQLQAIQESKPKSLPGWLDAPKKIAGFVLGIGTLLSVVWAVTLGTGRIVTAPQDIEAANAKIKALESHHHEEEAVFATLARSDSTILANQDSFKVQVGDNTARQKFLFCRGATLDSIRGFTDSIPDECRAEWERP
jgi:hypothetical protein